MHSIIKFLKIPSILYFSNVKGFYFYFSLRRCFFISSYNYNLESAFLVWVVLFTVSLSL